MWRSLGCQVHVPYPLSVSRPFGQAIRSYSSSLSSSPFRSPNDRQINPPQPIYAFPPVALRVGRKKARVVPHDAAEVRGLYRSLIRAVQRFWDVRTREFLLDRIKKGFRDYAYWTWGPRVTSKLRDARKVSKGGNKAFMSTPSLISNLSSSPLPPYSSHRAFESFRELMMGIESILKDYWSWPMDGVVGYDTCISR